FVRLYSKVILTLAIVSCLITALVFTYSKIIIFFIYGEKWMGAVPYMEILIVASFFYTLETFNRIVFKTYNRTRQILNLEIIKKCFQIVTIIIGIFLKDIMFLLLGYVITNVFSYLINVYFARKILPKLNWKEVLNIFTIFFVAALISLCFKYVLFHFTNGNIIDILLAPVFILIYLLVLKQLRIFNFISEFRNSLKILNSKN